MSVTNVQNSSNTYNASGTQSSASKNSMDQNTFFKILSAQLQYQDPTQAADTTAYISQLAQFSALEQMSNLNNSFKKMMSIQNIQLGSDLIGKEVSINDGSDSGLSGVVDGFVIEDGTVQLSVGGKYYTIDKVMAAREKASASTAASTT